MTVDVRFATGESGGNSLLVRSCASSAAVLVRGRGPSARWEAARASKAAPSSAMDEFRIAAQAASVARTCGTAFSNARTSGAIVARLYALSSTESGKSDPKSQTSVEVTNSESLQTGA